MQVLPLPLPSSPPASPRRSSAHIRAQPHRRISSNVTRSVSPSSTASSTTPLVNPPSNSNLRLSVVDLTDSPLPSPCSSDPSLSLSLAPAPSPYSPFVISPSKPSRPPRAASPLPPSKSTPAFAAPQPRSAPVDLAVPSRPGTPRKRATFLLPSDGDSDRDRDREGEGESTHDDSDDSDRLSFFSAEEFMVPASVVHGAVNGQGRVIDAQSLQDRDEGGRWLSPEPQGEAPREQSNVEREKEHDATHGLRRWHALMEIVHTEVGYVRDLRVLVNVYLKILPSLSLSAPARDAVLELAREGAELLALHERFSRALEGASARAAGGASPSGSVDDAITQVAGLFVDEASTFDLYQRFCATQPDVLRLLRPAQARSEWSAFERQCAAGGGDTESEQVSPTESHSRERSISHTDVHASTPDAVAASRSKSTPTAGPSRKGAPPRTSSLMPSAFKSHAASSSSQTPSLSANPRRHSYDSLAAVFGTYSSGTSRPRPGLVRPNLVSTARDNKPVSAPTSPNARLRFHDFLIKPVQRICKYPLMLEGLRSKAHGESVDAAVASAVEGMRAVAARVDDARRRRDAAVKSKLIVERIEPHAVVTPDFLSSLGDCLLAGSLDIVHHHQVLAPITTPVRVKYLGAFLYLGGYLILVKVGKSKVYRIKHWFSLAEFELVDIPQDIALVPSSFRLSYMGHHFEIAAACQREKDLWMRAINEARYSPPAWSLEPASSLHLESPGTPAAADRGTSDTAEPIAPIKRGGSSASMSELSNPLAVLRLASTRSRVTVPAPTVRYIFSNTDEFSILLQRSSGANRAFVDRKLVDVLSDLVSSLRKQSQAREELLFPPPQLSDMSQTIGRAAKNKIMRRGNVLLARPRSMLVPDVVAATTDEDTGAEPSTVRRKSTTYRKRMSMIPALSVLYTEPENIDAGSAPVAGDELHFPRPDDSLDKSPPPSAPASLPTSPPVPSQSQASQPSDAEVLDNSQQYHRRARSLVGSVKELVRRATTKSTSSQEASEAWQVLNTPEDSSSDAGESTETGTKSSIGRRRVSSAPTSPQPSSATSIFLADGGQRSAPMTTSFDDPTPSDMGAPSPSRSKTGKKLGPVPSNSNHTLKPKRSFKSFMFYNRLTAADHPA